MGHVFATHPKKLGHICQGQTKDAPYESKASKALSLKNFFKGNYQATAASIVLMLAGITLIPVRIVLIPIGIAPIPVGIVLILAESG